MRARTRSATLTVLVVGLSLLTVIAPTAAAHAPRSSPPEQGASGGSAGRAAIAPPEPTRGLLLLNTTVSPATVCAFGSTTCPGGPSARSVRISASIAAPATLVAPTSGTRVQVLFLLEELVYDGVCSGDWGLGGWSAAGRCVGNDAVGLANLSLFLSNFYGNASRYSEAIQLEHPGLNLTFGVAVVQSTLDAQDDGDSPPFGVLVGNFVNASSLGPALRSSPFRGWTYDEDTADNLLHAPSITGLYGALTGQWVNWSAGADHVIVDIAVTAPRAPSYAEDYCAMEVSAASCVSGTCEPAAGNDAIPAGGYIGVAYPRFRIPACEGWVAPPSNNSTASVAYLASWGAECASTPLGGCPVDVIDLPGAPDLPNSTEWAVRFGSSGFTNVLGDVRAVIGSGCALASATGGTWDGPVSASCPSGVTGTIPDDLHNATARSAENASLLEAVGAIGLGLRPLAPAARAPAAGAVRLELGPGVEPASPLNASVSCSGAELPNASCAPTPNVAFVGGAWTLTWNWSQNATDGAIAFGETWTASFDVDVNATEIGPFALLVCPEGGCIAPLNPDNGSGVSFAYLGSPTTGFEPFPELSVEAVSPPSLGVALTPMGPTAEVGVPASFLVTFAGGVPPYSGSVSFSDGGASDAVPSGRSVLHAFALPGAYVVQVQAQDAHGGNASALVVENVAAALSVHIETPTTGPAGASWLFTAVASYGVGATSFVWNFGDASANEAGPVAVHTFSFAGTFLVDVQATDSDGGTAIASAEVVVTPAEGAANQAPVPALETAIVAAPTAPLAWGCSGGVAVPPYAQFSGSASGGAPPYAYAWIFGDGHTASGPSVSHAYLRSETFNVTLLVTDASNATATAAVSVVVRSASCVPQAVASYAPAPTGSVVLLGIGFAAGIGVAALVLRPRPRRRPGRPRSVTRGRGGSRGRR